MQFYNPTKSLLLETKRVFKFLYLQMFGLK